MVLERIWINKIKTIPSGIIELKFGTFENCTSLTTVNLSSEMTEMSNNVNGYQIQYSTNKKFKNGNKR